MQDRLVTALTTPFSTLKFSIFISVPLLCQKSFQINGDYFEGVLRKEASKVAQLVENLPANARDTGLIPVSGRSPGEGNGNQLQYSSLENPMDRGALWTTVHGVSKSQTQLSD